MIRVHQSVHIARPAAELFGMWRNLDVMARIFTHVDAITPIAAGRWHWVVRGSAATRAEWDAEVVDEVEHHRIDWKSLPNELGECAGSVRFVQTGEDASTEVGVLLLYTPTSEALDAALRCALGPDPERQVNGDLVRLKRQIEAGETPTKDVVQEASEESFPASDAPAWTAR